MAANANLVLLQGTVISIIDRHKAPRGVKFWLKHTDGKGIEFHVPCRANAKALEGVQDPDSIDVHSHLIVEGKLKSSDDNPFIKLIELSKITMIS